MWILPKQLHTSAYVPDMAALNLDSSESSQLCAQSLFVRSKPSLAQTWLQKWKRDLWTQHLFGRILKPSLGQSFVTAWTSSLEVTHANHSVAQASDLGEKTQDTCGPTFQTGFDFFNQASASLKMSRGTLPKGSITSCPNWENWVTEQRGEYSQRAKLARLTNASGCLSWPTAKARDWKDTAGCSLDAVNPDGTQRNRRDRLMGAVMAEMSGPAAPVNHSTHGSRPESWPTARSLDGQVNESLETWEIRKQNKAEQGINLHRPLPIAVAQEIKKQESWATPRAGKTTDENTETWAKRQAKGDVATMPLTAQVKAWATPRCSMAQDKQDDSGKHRLGEQAQNGTSGKLNPRWVETLMGLPVGWTMPSCGQPIANPASVAMTLSAGNAEDTTRTAHVLGQIVWMTDNRTDELRLLGNGVVPATAELAFITLMQQL